MRVAVCISGVCQSGNPKNTLVRNNKIQKEKFPTADFYYATWDTYRYNFESTFLNEQCFFFPEPVMNYHPYEIEKQYHISTFYQDTANWVRKGGPQRIEWTSHHTKQILIHTWLIDKIKENYDIIVRTRFDGFIYKNADFSEYLKDTVKNHRANGFGATKKEKFDLLTEFANKNTSMHGSWLIDQLIIHNSDAIDIDFVNRLHNTKQLHAAEYGWYQVISMPHGSNHRNHDGWVNHDRNVLDRFLLEKE